MPGLAALTPTLRAVVHTVIPEAAALDERAWTEVETIVERALAARPPRLQRQLVMLLRALQWLPVLRYGRRFTALHPTQRQRVLAAMQDAPLLLLRRGFWGLRTLLLMGYYGRSGAAAEIGYRGDPRGWDARRP